MKKIFFILSLTIYATSAFAGEWFKRSDMELLDQAAAKVSSYVSNLIPGEGYTEVSIDLRDDYSPDYSILGVREVVPMNSGTFFTQFSLQNSEADTGDGGDERITTNLGLGVRKLLNNNTFMVGLNTFYDRDIENEHQRGSLGAELRTAVIETNYNYYFKIQEDGTESENVLEGYDFQLSSQIPYLHWAKVFVNTYEWYGQTRDDVTGKKIGSEILPIGVFTILDLNS